MTRMVSVWLPNLPIERLKRRREAARPFRLTGPSRSSAARIAGSCSPRSMPPPRAGLYPGYGSRRRPRHLLRISSPRRPNLRKMPQASLALARWSSRYSPSLNVDGTDGLWLDVSGIPHLFGGVSELLADMAMRFARLGFSVRLALAETLGGAHALARFARASPSIVPPGKIAEALAPLPVEALRLDSDVTRLLKRLGLKRIGQTLRSAARRARAAVPFARGGRGRARRLDQALGRREEPRNPLLPAPDYAARLPFPEPLITHDGVIAGLDHLAGELCQALGAARRGARRLQSHDLSCRRLLRRHRGWLERAMP